MPPQPSRLPHPASSRASTTTTTHSQSPHATLTRQLPTPTTSIATTAADLPPKILTPPLSPLPTAPSMHTHLPTPTSCPRNHHRTCHRPSPTPDRPHPRRPPCALSPTLQTLPTSSSSTPLFVTTHAYHLRPPTTVRDSAQFTNHHNCFVDTCFVPDMMLHCTARPGPPGHKPPRLLLPTGLRSLALQSPRIDHLPRSTRQSTTQSPYHHQHTHTHYRSGVSRESAPSCGIQARVVTFSVPTIILANDRCAQEITTITLLPSELQTPAKLRASTNMHLQGLRFIYTPTPPICLMIAPICWILPYSIIYLCVLLQV
uniref:Uncharacterized protein n=1 Tax=Physcomitrium patens TaxID=3218 RepID=A0A2K1IRU5_PHYPA|nr:hypothetical protein PHYPA_026122 [Physcomitrium patens]